ncbi:MAG: DNA alkylation repair protein [Patescibacteria group bacterium]|jgi:3-methyladenine DNA glycosylase AlkD
MELAIKIRSAIREAAKNSSQKDADFVQKYLGTKRMFICVKSADRDKIIRKYSGELKNLDPKEAITVLNQLFASDTFEDINFAGKILTKLPNVRAELSLDQIRKWILKTSGWAECDGIVQSLFTGKEILERMDEWQKSIPKFSSNKNIQLRRASLVIQCKPNREVSDPRMRKLAFETIEKLKSEKEILITKAISWLLRDLSRQNKEEVKEYLQKNKSTLPTIAYRETMKKIETGKK